MNYGYYFRLTNTNKCSIIILVKQKKPILSNGVGAHTQIDFFNTYIQIRCPERTRI